MELPPCPNFTEGTCIRSEVIVAKETDDAFIFNCRTCGCVNIFPKDRNEKHAKYQSFLKQKFDMEQRRKSAERAPSYSFTSMGRKS
jgi:hypothetical protein